MSKTKKSKTSAKKTISIVLFGAYILILLYILFFSRLGSDRSITYSEWLKTMYNFIPFRNLYDFITAPVKTREYLFIILENIFGNLILFMPFGFFIPLLFGKCADFKVFIIIALLSILIVETAQFIFMLGAFDINDIILNSAGAIIGFGLARLIIKRGNKS